MTELLKGQRALLSMFNKFLPEKRKICNVGWIVVKWQIEYIEAQNYIQRIQEAAPTIYEEFIETLRLHQRNSISVKEVGNNMNNTNTG